MSQLSSRPLPNAELDGFRKLKGSKKAKTHRFGTQSRWKQRVGHVSTAGAKSSLVHSLWRTGQGHPDLLFLAADAASEPGPPLHRYGLLTRIPSRFLGGCFLASPYQHLMYTILNQLTLVSLSSQNKVSE
ncbi:hypothetical protein CB1_000964010 [Camelus ferus]|nr:hypothetical protein CB1_000964010 [Camelus ferus]